MSKRNTVHGTFSADEIIAMLAMVFTPSQLKNARDYLATFAMRGDTSGMSLGEIRDIWLMVDSARFVVCGTPVRRSDPHVMFERAMEHKAQRRNADAYIDPCIAFEADR